jgi:hypothetical protein
MTDQPQRDVRWTRLASGTLVTIGFAVIVAWGARSFGRSLAFAFGINWILMAWAITLGRVLESAAGAWDGLSIQLPASYYATRSFEKGGRVYDHLGVRWYRRLLRPMLWSVKPALLRSQQGARETMIRATHNPDAGHLLIFVVIIGITLWALISGWWETVAWLLLFNLLHNGYPMMSMRQLRARLNRREGELRRGAI